MAMRFSRVAEIDDQLKAIAAELTVDEQQSGLVCPFCSGGPTKERSMSVRRSAYGLFYKCHRAGCAEKGILDMFTLEPKRPVLKLKPQDPMRNMTFGPIPPEVAQMLQTKHHINEALLGWAGVRWITNIRRLGIPIRRATGIPIGITARSVDPKDKPKSLIFLHTPDTVLGAFYMEDVRQQRMWVVEDQLSAMRLSYAARENVVALLGTSLSESLVQEMKRLGVAEIVVCLDADAFDKTVAINLKYRGIFGHIKIKKPIKDLKDMTPEELDRFVKGE